MAAADINERIRAALRKLSLRQDIEENHLDAAVETLAKVAAKIHGEPRPANGRQEIKNDRRRIARTSS